MTEAEIVEYNINKRIGYAKMDVRMVLEDLRNDDVELDRDDLISILANTEKRLVSVERARGTCGTPFNIKA